jgi:hypothetical protein
MIAHECLTVERAKKMIEHMNDVELSSLQLELGIVSGVEK